LVLSCTISEIWWFIGTKIVKIANFFPPQSHKSSSLWVKPLQNFVTNQIFPETKMFGLSDGKEIMTLAFFVLIQYWSMTDRRTDRHMDRQIEIPSLAIPAVA